MANSPAEAVDDSEIVIPKRKYQMWAVRGTVPVQYELASGDASRANQSRIDDRDLVR
jgi:hypothetical protein